jgi:hypothetical protein
VTHVIKEDELVTRFYAILFGIAFIFVGVAGFLPSFNQDALLFGYLSDGKIHNMIFIVAGVLAIMAATSYYACRLYFQLAGTVYIVLGIWGLLAGGNLRFMQVQMFDNILYIVIGIFALAIGFGHGIENE